jgi:hypothetical protein
LSLIGVELDRRCVVDTRKPAQAQPFGVAAAISAEGDAEGQTLSPKEGQGDRDEAAEEQTELVCIARRISL